MINKFDIENARNWVKDMIWKLRYADEIMAAIIVGGFYITLAVSLYLGLR